jgi:hypothetical protein
MLRAFLCSVAVLALFLGGALADEKGKQDNKNRDKGQQATITKVDVQNGTITIKMKDKDGKEVERTFNLTEEVQMFDDNGKTIRLADIDIFRSGDYVLVVEREGKLREIHKDKGVKKPTPKPQEK